MSNESGIETALNCTVNENSDCTDCGMGSVLACKWNSRTLAAFIVTALPTFFMAIFGMIALGKMTGAWWPLIIYFIYLVFIFSWEIRFLCSHCPYYAGMGKTLKCLGNNGALKLFKYNPDPIGGFGKFMMVWLVISVYFIFPLSTSGYALYHAIANSLGAVTIWGMTGIVTGCLVTAVAFIVVLRVFFCSRCVNFSCVFNTVEKETLNAYLEKNPVILRAWKQSGYDIQNTRSEASG